MNDWFRKDLGDPMLADNELFLLREQFAYLYRHAAASEHASVFTRNENAEQLHCHLVLYFSPDAAELANYYNAESCPPPVSDDLSLFVDNSALLSH